MSALGKSEWYQTSGRSPERRAAVRTHHPEKSEVFATQIKLLADASLTATAGESISRALDAIFTAVHVLLEIAAAGPKQIARTFRQDPIAVLTLTLTPSVRAIAPMTRNAPFCRIPSAASVHSASAKSRAPPTPIAHPIRLSMMMRRARIVVLFLFATGRLKSVSIAPTTPIASWPTGTAFTVNPLRPLRDASTRNRAPRTRIAKGSLLRFAIHQAKNV
jgi:hypothetical protein